MEAPKRRGAGGTRRLVVGLARSTYAPSEPSTSTSLDLSRPAGTSPPAQTVTDLHAPFASSRSFPEMLGVLLPENRMFVKVRAAAARGTCEARRERVQRSRGEDASGREARDRVGGPLAGGQGPPLAAFVRLRARPAPPTRGRFFARSPPPPLGTYRSAAGRRW